MQSLQKGQLRLTFIMLKLVTYKMLLPKSKTVLSNSTSGVFLM